MHLFIYFFSVFKKHKARYFACILGFGVALGAVFGVSAYSAILDDTVNRFYFLEDNSYLVLSKGTNVLQIIPFESQIPDNVSISLLENAGVTYTLPIIFKNFSNETQFKWLKNVIVGISFSNLRNFYMKDIGLQEGNWPQDPDTEIVVGPNIEFENLTLGSVIPIRGKNLTVSGILNPSNVFFDKFIYLDYSLSQNLFDMDGLCTVIYVLGNPDILNNPQIIQSLEDSVESQYPFIDFIDSDELDEASGFFYQMLDVFNVIMTLFPLFISGLFIFILMLLNVKDQEQEFGMLRAIGMPLEYIGLIIFFQSILITGFGYFISLITGNLYFMYGFYVFRKNAETKNIFSYVREMIQQIPSSIYIQTLIVSLLIGIFIAIYPSFRAMRQSIVQTFRKEE
ncbi:ABC transporter permease [Candidatus Harpocratesius sp.]